MLSRQSGCKRGGRGRARERAAVVSGQGEERLALAGGASGHESRANLLVLSPKPSSAQTAVNCASQHARRAQAVTGIDAAESAPFEGARRCGWTKERRTWHSVDAPTRLAVIDVLERNHFPDVAVWTLLR